MVDSVRDRRRALGLTQEQLAGLARLHVSQLRKLEGGEIDAGNMTARNLLNLAEALQLDPLQIVYPEASRTFAPVSEVLKEFGRLHAEAARAAACTDNPTEAVIQRERRIAFEAAMEVLTGDPLDMLECWMASQATPGGLRLWTQYVNPAHTD